VRKVFLDDLPKYIIGRYIGKINWDASVGMFLEFIYDNINGCIEILEYLKSSQTLKVKYNHCVYSIKTGNLIKAKLGGIIGVFSKDYTFNIGDTIKDEHKNIKITNRWRDSGRAVYECVCLKCKTDKWTTWGSTLSHITNCPYCCNRRVKVGLNDIPTTAPWMIRYFQGGASEASLYTKSSNKIVYFKCPDCGTVKETPMIINTLYQNGGSIACKCSDGRSYPEKFMTAVFDQINIEYTYGYKPDWLIGYDGSYSPAVYDYYLPKLNLIIEMDGGIGHGKKIHAHSKLSLRETKLKDIWKDERALKKGLRVIRITADKSNVGFLSTQIICSLAKYIDLTNIDWDRCNELATKNIVKEVCEYYEAHKEGLMRNIAERFKLSNGTITTYLKRGREIGWCDYDPKASRINAARKAGRHGRRVCIYKDGVALGEYPSVPELVRHCSRDLHVQFIHSRVCAAARGDINNYKGFVFKYM
jgi:hypothetical protein